MLSIRKGSQPEEIREDFRKEVTVGSYRMDKLGYEDFREKHSKKWEQSTQRLKGQNRGWSCLSGAWVRGIRRIEAIGLVWKRLVPV